MSRAPRWTALLVLAALAGLGVRPAPAEPVRTRYAPVPPGIAALVGTTAEEAVATRAIAAVESRDPAEAFAARAELLLSGNAGLRRVAERLAERPMTAEGLVICLQVASASPIPETDVLLARAADEGRFEARALAARGLGAGRTPAATETLSRLARDPMPAVRGAALRSLFAVEEPSARAARLALPTDADPRIATLRLRLHRQREDAGPELLTLAWRAYAGRAPPAVRVEAARCLALPATRAPVGALAAVVGELGGFDELAAWVRWAFDAPAGGYDAAQGRLAAAEALLEWLSRPEVPAARRTALVDLAVRWIAHPARVRARSVDEEARTLLFAALPDVGDALVDPVTRRLLSDGFEDPLHGVRLLAALEPALAVPALTRLLDPAAQASRAVVGAVSGALRDLGRVGDEAAVRALFAPTQPVDVRTDALLALRGEGPDLALPLLEAALRGDDDALASTAASALAERPEPRARAALLEALLDPRWRPHEDQLLAQLCTKPDDALWAALAKGMRDGPQELRRSIFDCMRLPRSGLRGPRAVALVRMPMEDPSLGLDPVKIAGALAAVDGPACVEYVRARFARVPYDARRIMLRDLQAVEDASARELALAVAAATPDADEGMLGEVVTVLMGRCAKDAARTDPFWRRLLKSKGVLRGVVAAQLAKADERTGAPDIPRGDLSALLVPIVADDLEPTEEVRLNALKALVLGPWSGAEDFVWLLAANPREQDDLREASARVLVGRARPDTRAKALAWLGEPCLESKEVVVEIGRLAGLGATPTEAAWILRLLEKTLAARDRAQPYWREATEASALEAYTTRVRALVAALAVSGDAPSLAALGGHLFDPRFAGESAGAIRREKSTFSGGDDALAPLDDPPTLEVILHVAEEGGGARATPTSPVGPEVRALVEGLKRAGTGDAAHAASVEAFVARAVEDARARGDLAAFQDLYLAKVAVRLRSRDREEPPGDFSAAAVRVEDEMTRTWPADGPEEYAMRYTHAEDHRRAGRFAEAAAEMGRAASLGARTGIADLSPSIWVDRGRPPFPSWRRLRAREDLYAGAAAAADGRPEEARAAFRRGLARDPLDPSTRRLAARLRAATRFDLESAEADARRAVLLDRRQGESRSLDRDATLAFVLAAKSGSTPPPDDPPAAPGGVRDGE